MAKNEWGATTALIDAAARILKAENPMTVRQLFYRLVSVELVPNSRAAYQRVSGVMTKARNDGRVDFDWIADRSRPEYAVNAFADPAEYGEAVKRSYRKDYWATQPGYCEIWCEKDAIIGSIQATASDLGVTVRVGRGFLSTTKAHEIASHFARITKPITAFYLGDHDPSGRNIETDFKTRISGYGSGPFTLKRLAIHAADIAKFHLPPLRVKLSDSRAGEFLSRYSDRCVELDALPPNELRRRIREAVEALLDRNLWDRAIAVEKVEIASIVDTVARRPRLKPVTHHQQRQGNSIGR